MNASLSDAERFVSLIARPGDVFELRALSKGRSVPQVTAGYFDDLHALAEAAVARSGKDDGVYVTINPVNPALLARAPANRVRQAGNGDTTSDRDVQIRRCLLVDVDPVRPTGISSTNDEHAAAIEMSGRIARELAAEGWPDPIHADSGNGGHLVYGIELPAEDGGLVKRVLAALSARFTTPSLKVDEKVFNPARISKFYGTLTRKGENTTERPHRLARIISAPDQLIAVTRAQLEALAPAKIENRPSTRPLPFNGESKFDIDAWIAEHLPGAVAQSWSEGRKWLLPICPFNDSHNRREAYITEKHSGQLAAGCQHESCFKTWRELRLRFESNAYDRQHANGTQRLSHREPPHEVLYEDESYRSADQGRSDIDAFADRDRDKPTDPKTPTKTTGAEEVKVPRLISIAEALAELADLANAPVYPTPFPTLNDAIGFGGLLGTQVYTVAAGTGRGKTSWVAALASHAAQTVPVLVASWEMRPGYFCARNAAGILGYHSNAIIRGEVPIERVMDAMPFPRFMFMHKPSLAELRIGVDVMAQRFGAAPLVVIDYIQKLANFISRRMVRPDQRAATSEASEALCDIGETSRSPIVAVSAIGRGNNKRVAKPRDLEPYELVDVAKESGDVEYDGAGLIVLSLDKQFDGDYRVATMTLAKARFGEECHIDARYNGARGEWLDRGRYQRVEKAPEGKSTAGAGSAIELRESVFRALKNSRDPMSKNDIHKVSGKNKTAILSEIDAMVDRGLIKQVGTKFALSNYEPIYTAQMRMADEP